MSRLSRKNGPLLPFFKKLSCWHADDATAPEDDLKDIGDKLFTDNDTHDLFESMVTTEIEHVLKNESAGNVTFTAADQNEMRVLVEEQMKRAIKQRKFYAEQNEQANLYTPLTRELLAAHRQFNSSAATISALGAGFTFSLIFQNLPDPSAALSKEHVKACLAVAWLLFMLAILTTSFITAVQAMHENTINQTLLYWRILDGVFLLAAFMMSAEAARAYQPAVAIVALGSFGFFAIFILVFSVCTRRSAIRMREQLQKL